MNFCFSDESWEEYLYWQGQDKKTLKRINKLLKDISRHPFEGIGKPEPLKFEFQGAWSRRINEKDRLIYMIEENTVYILSLKNHYD